MYQTLSEFIQRPFGKHEKLNLDYQTRYNKYRNTNKIKLVGVSQIDNRYYSHLTVPSESNDKLNYDVVIMFFPDEKRIEKDFNLLRYKCKFFSNSPSFIYKYAALYKKNGYLVEELYDKLDIEYSDKLPDKSNPEYDMCYDKSIFFACRYLLDHNLTTLSKIGLLIKKRSFNEFASTIKDFNTVKKASSNRQTKKDKVNQLEDTINKLTDKHNPLKKINPHPGAKIIKPKAKKSKVGYKTKTKPKSRTSGIK